MPYIAHFLVSFEHILTLFPKGKIYFIVLISIGNNAMASTIRD